MSNDSDGVVDTEFQVYGVDGLRVVDGSVLPRIVSANLNAPIQMLAHRASDFILKNKQLSPLNVPFAFQKN